MAGIYIGNELFFNRFKMNLDLYTNSENMGDHTIGFERINYFIQDIVQRSVFITETDQDGINKLANADIPLLTVPEPGAYDQVVQAVIVTKLNAILEDALIITESEIMSHLGGFVTYVFDVADEDDEDEIHELVNTEDPKKWWAKKEPDYVSGTTETTMTWKDLQLHWVDEEDEDEDLEIVFTPESLKKSLTEEKEESTIINMNDFNKKK